jgi:hypothetical protein
MASGSLTIVGTGIQLGQASLEARTSIAAADKVLYLVADALTIGWILKLNPAAESLHVFYRRHRPRLVSYEKMTERMLGFVRDGLNVCAAFYGHPGVFVYPAHEAIRRARKEGFRARMLPGISAPDCLFADLGLDPAQTGCQCFEASDFLICRRRFDTSSALILLQIGVIGEPGYKRRCNRRGLRILAETLQQYYPPGHEIILYQAAQYPLCDPVVERVALAELPRAAVTVGTTLYVPPGRAARPQPAMLRRLRLPLKKPQVRRTHSAARQS